MSDQNGRPTAAQIAAWCVRDAVELRAYLTGLLRDPDLAGEVAQAAIARAVEQGHAAQAATFKAWLFRVAHNEAMDRRRRRATEKRVVQKSAWWKRPAEGANAETAEQTASRQETAERVRAAVARLPAEQREVVRLRIEQDKTFAQIAELTAAPLGTVLTRMRLATKKLAEALKDEA